MAAVAPLSEGWPTRSQLASSTFGHLGKFADWSERIANKADSAFEELAREVRRPGGVEWNGAASEQALNRAEMDLVKVRGWAWDHRDAASVARRGQEQMEAGQREALHAIDDAERDGFQVGDDYSVRDTRQVSSRTELAERQGQAQAHSNYIRHRVAHLVANDRNITTQLNDTTAKFGTLTFEESPGSTHAKNGRIQPVDNTTTTPSTTSTAPMPECDLAEIAKLHRKVDDLDRREHALRAKIDAFNKLPHDFDANDPSQVQAAKAYEAQRDSLVKQRDTLAHEELELGRDLKECEVKMYSRNGQEIIEWPDGSSTPTPTPTPALTPAPPPRR
jgi:hypothetical protein